MYAQGKYFYKPNSMFLLTAAFKKTTTNFLFKLSKHQILTIRDAFKACYWSLKTD